MKKICELCGIRPARYVCQECGRSACEFCFIPERWLCTECYKKLAYPTSAPTLTGIRINFPYKLFLAGFILILIGTLILMLSSLYAPSAQGGLIWIFPLPPLAFGTTQGEGWPLIVTVFTIIFLVILVLITYKILKV